MEQGTIKKTAIYLRVSTEEQTHNFSISSQKDLLLNHIKQNDLELSDQYVDDGYSGTTMERPQLKRLLEDAKAKKFDLVLVYRVDRFFRSNKDLLTVTSLLQELGIAIKSISEPFDTVTSEGKLMLSVLGSFAEFERNSIVERSKHVKLRRLKEGYYAGCRPKFGYDYDRETKKLTVNQKEAEIVRLIFKRYSEPDGSILKVTRDLRAMGHKTKFGNEWETDRVNAILRDETYTGIWYGNKNSSKGGKKPRDEWIRMEVPRVISKDIFKRTQHLLDQRKILAKRNTKHEYLLSGLMRCGDCGSKLSGVTDNNNSLKNGKKYGPYTRQYYRCVSYALNRIEPRKTCRLRWIEGEELEEIVWGKIEQIISNPYLVGKMIQAQYKETKGSGLNGELSRLQGEIRKVQKQEKRILGVFQEGIISKSQLKGQLDDITEKKGTLADKIAETEGRIRNKEQVKDKVAEFSEFLSELKDKVKRLDLEKKKQILNLLKVRIAIGVDGGVDIECTIPVELPRNSQSPAIAWETPTFCQYQDCT